MAKKNKYRVTETDNLLELAKKFRTTVGELLNLNGIQSLTPGQTIQVPSERRRHSPSGNFQPKQEPNWFINFMDQLTGYDETEIKERTRSRGNDNPVVGGPKVNPSPVQFTPPVNPFTSAGSQARMNESYVPPNIPAFRPEPNNPTMNFMGAVGNWLQNTNRNYNPSAQQPAPFMTQAMITPQQQPAPFMTQSMLNPPISTGYQDYGQRVNAGVTPTNALPNTQPQRPTGVYTGGNSASDQQWRNYWNQQVANPQQGVPPPPRVMSRNEIWNMKVAGRRKKEMQSMGDELPKMKENKGNASNSNLTWRVG